MAEIVSRLAFCPSEKVSGLKIRHSSMIEILEKAIGSYLHFKERKKKDGTKLLSSKYRRNVKK